MFSLDDCATSLPDTALDFWGRCSCARAAWLALVRALLHRSRRSVVEFSILLRCHLRCRYSGRDSRYSLLDQHSGTSHFRVITRLCEPFPFRMIFVPRLSCIEPKSSNQAMELTASRRTTQLYMNSIPQPTATRALARGGRSCVSLGL